MRLALAVIVLIVALVVYAHVREPWLFAARPVCPHEAIWWQAGRQWLCGDSITITGGG